MKICEKNLWKSVKNLWKSVKNLWKSVKKNQSLIVVKRTESGRASVVLGMLSHSVTMLCDCESYCFAYRLPQTVLTPQRRVPTLSRRATLPFFLHREKLFLNTNWNPNWNPNQNRIFFCIFPLWFLFSIWLVHQASFRFFKHLLKK